MTTFAADIPGPVPEQEKLLLSYLQRKAGEGMALLKKERAFEMIPECMNFIEGKQEILRSRALSKVYSNRLRKIALETVSSLTDVRPIWNYDTFSSEFKPQAEILTKLAKAWWKNGYVDRKLASTLMFSSVGGSGYAVLGWNEEIPGGGDLEFIPYDPRDVIPIDPVYGDSVQSWRGVILREKLPKATVCAMFPEKSGYIEDVPGSWLSMPPRDSGSVYSLLSPTYTYMTTSWDRAMGQPKGVDLMRIFIKDDRVNSSGVEIQMGDPNKNWSYKVPFVGQILPDGRMADRVDAKLYPRGRLIVCTPTCILSDGPNPYWHGMFPVIRFTLDPLPWSLLGASMIADLIPLQNALNEGLRGIEDGMSQWIKRGIIADKTAMSQTNMDKLDTRRPGLKALVAPGTGEGFKIVDGPNLPEWYLTMMEFIQNTMDDNSGVRGLQQLSQMRQMPSVDSMEKYMEALSPLLRLRARSIEVSLGELAEMLKVSFFQYYTVARRMQILGNDGITLEDFDFDPGSLVPAPEGGDLAPREARAQRHHRNFTFSVAPNSFLNVTQSTQKMMILQLLRANLMDPWTAWETLNVPNIGNPPAETVTDRLIAAKQLGLIMGPPPEVVQATNMAQMAQAQMMVQQAAVASAMGPAPPQGGAPVNTSGTTPEGGRPPEGGQPPQMVQKSDGRQIISESGK